MMVVSTQCFKYKAKRSSSVDTRSGSVDTRDSSQKTFWPIWDSVSTLAQSEVEEDLDFPQPFSTSPVLQTCYSRPQLVAKPSPRV
ncbi:hypothetical protein Taro_046858 [Colocasia esculenta]|uniref:Uncharacterized protein n=1 Tax=Colocasia esculenta TaxID=4460 RepID=A0A843WTL4_COLES|nr:hypothetical protein [Colocasia esculenta]